MTHVPECLSGLFLYSIFYLEDMIHVPECLSVPLYYTWRIWPMFLSVCLVCSSTPPSTTPSWSLLVFPMRPEIYNRFPTSNKWLFIGKSFLKWGWISIIFLFLIKLELGKWRHCPLLFSETRGFSHKCSLFPSVYEFNIFALRENNLFSINSFILSKLSWSNVVQCVYTTEL